MNILGIKDRAQILRCLVEGNSIRSTSRITGHSKNTVIKLLCKLGFACYNYQDKMLRNLTCRHIQCDEIWSFCNTKEKNLSEGKKNQIGYGSIWTWVAICTKTKLVPSWLVGKRCVNHASIFISDLATRLKNKVQLTTDGLKLYLDAIEESFGTKIDYAMLVKVYGKDPEHDRNYFNSICVENKKRTIIGNPDPKDISTSHVERQNLTMRMSMRRFTRQTNAFSKKIENHKHAISIHFMYYNFARIHLSLRISPAMEAGITNHLWSLEEIAGLC